MRASALLFLLALLLAPARALASLEGWEPAPPLAPEVQRAAAARQLVLVLVTTSWCPSCRILERSLASPRVRASLASQRRLAYDAEAGEGVDVARRYNAIAFPTLLVLGGDGRERGRVTGDLPPDALVRALERIRDGSETLAALERELARAPGELRLALRLGSEWALRGERTAALRHLERVLAADADNRRGLAAAALLARGKYLELRSRQDHAAAERTLSELRRRFPRAPEASAAVYSLAQAIHQQGRGPEALALLNGWAKSAEEHDTVVWFCLRQRLCSPVGLRHGERATALRPSEASHHTNLSELQELCGRREAAIASLRRAIALGAADPRQRARLARLLHQPR
jgi:thioredoxin-like negative regulator of GroEL